MNYIAYYRVSTQKQGISGLGLESQKNIVLNFLSNDDTLLDEFTEVESGKKNNRIELENALKKCKETNSTLVVAKLDRLSRDIEFLFKTVNSGVEIKFADMPIMNTLTLGIMATISQYERELISSRTKLALEQKKKQGVKLGVNNLTKSGIEKSKYTRKMKAKNDSNNLRAYALIISLRKQNLSLRQIAFSLNKSKFRTSRANIFYPNSVKQIINFFENN